MSDDKQINGYINPYNFVRLPKEKALADKTEGLLSGSFEIEITTKTPLFIANSTQPSDKNVPKIFYTDSDIDPKSSNKFYEPVIPGSSIKGVVRSMHEAIFKSCLSQIDDSRLTFRNTPNGSLKNPIMIIRDKPNHFKAFDAIKTISTKKLLSLGYYPRPKVTGDGYEMTARGGACFSNYSLVNIVDDHIQKFIPSEDVPLDEQTFQLLVIGEKFGDSGPSCTLYQKDYSPIPEPFDSDLQDQIKSDINTINKIKDQYMNDKINKNLSTGSHFGYKDYSTKADVFLYFTNGLKATNRLVSISPIGRTTIKKTFSDFATNVSGVSFAPCSDKDNLCKSCKMFGMVNGNVIIPSRIIFSDAKIAKESNPSEYYLSYPLYLVSSQARPANLGFYYNVESSFTGTCDNDYPSNKFSFGVLLTKNSENITDYIHIKGRKFYLHHGSFTDYSLKKEYGTASMRTKILPVKSGKVFTGRVYFKNLTEEELDELIFSINLWKDTKNNQTHGHKLGMGKPFGLGSVIMKVKEESIRFGSHSKYLDLFSNSNSVSFKYKEPDGVYNFKEEPYLKDLETITRLEYFPHENICYPRFPNTVENSLTENGFEWFTDTTDCRLPPLDGDNLIKNQISTTRKEKPLHNESKNYYN